MAPLRQTPRATTLEKRELKISVTTCLVRQYRLTSAGDSIGEGTFGKVKLGTHKLTGEKVAVKILEKDRISEVADVERVAREI